MLAGKMRLNMFLLLVGVLIAAGIAVVVKGCQNTRAKPPAKVEPPPTDRPPERPPEPVTIDAGAAPTPSSDLAARAWDAEVIAWKDKSIGGDKVKDATKGKPYKLNLYKDAGQARVNRVKVDVDRDDKFDEKYTFEPGKITLQRAPADDEKYTETYHWTGSGWMRE